jgi:hypothetical protein
VALVHAGRAGLGEPGSGAAPLVLGRHDYTVRSMDAASGEERWNVTYGRLRAVTPPVPLGAQGGLVDEAAACGGALGEGAPACSCQKSSLNRSSYFACSYRQYGWSGKPPRGFGEGNAQG